MFIPTIEWHTTRKHICQTFIKGKSHIPTQMSQDLLTAEVKVDIYTLSITFCRLIKYKSIKLNVLANANIEL